MQETIACGRTARTVLFRRGRRVTSETKNIVCNDFAYFERQAKNERVSSSLLIHTATVTRIEHDQRQLPEGVEFRDTMSAFSCTSSFIAQKCPLVSDFTMSFGCRMVIPNNIASIVVALVPMYGERWLA